MMWCVVCVVDTGSHPKSIYSIQYTVYSMHYTVYLIYTQYTLPPITLDWHIELVTSYYTDEDIKFLYVCFPCLFIVWNVDYSLEFLIGIGIASNWRNVYSRHYSLYYNLLSSLHYTTLHTTLHAIHYMLQNLIIWVSYSYHIHCICRSYINAEDKPLPSSRRALIANSYDYW